MSDAKIAVGLPGILRIIQRIIMNCSPFVPTICEEGVICPESISNFVGPSLNMTPGRVPFATLMTWRQLLPVIDAKELKEIFFRIFFVFHEIFGYICREYCITI